MKVLIPVIGGDTMNIDVPQDRALHEIERKMVIQYVCESLLAIEGAEMVFVLHKDDIVRYHLDDIIRLIVPCAKIVVAQGKTQGAACSCLLAFDHFKMDEPLIISGSNQIVTINLNPIVKNFMKNNWDGGVVIFDDIHPRWSYVKLDNEGFLIEAAEKHPISRNATTGFYYYRKTGDFVNSAFSMIKKNSHINGQYYVCPTYNEMVLMGKKIGHYRIDKNQYFNLNYQKGIEMYTNYLRRRKSFAN